MAKSIFLGGEFQGFDNNGDPLPSGEVYFYEPGTLVAKAVYTDSTLATAHAQPVVLDANGRAAIWLSGAYRVRLYTSASALIYDEDNVNIETEAAANEGVNVLNGSFEFDTDVSGQPDNWTLTPGTNGTIEIDTADQIHGLNSLKFTGTDATGGGTATSQKFDVIDGSVINIHFTYKSSAVDALNSVAVKFYTAAGAVVSTLSAYSEGAANPATYTSYVKPVTVDAGATQAELIITGVDGSGTTVAATANFDDVYVDTHVNNSAIDIATVASPVNKIKVTDAATGNNPSIVVTGEDVGLDIEGVELHNGSIDNVTNMNGVAARSIVILDTPELLVNGATTTGSWQPVNSTTLATAGAKAAILRVRARQQIASGTVAQALAYIRKTGSGLSNTEITLVANSLNQTNTNRLMEAHSVAEITVNLDANQDFDWYMPITGASDWIYITLVGYYV